MTLSHLEMDFFLRQALIPIRTPTAPAFAVRLKLTFLEPNLIFILNRWRFLIPGVQRTLFVTDVQNQILLNEIYGDVHIVMHPCSTRIRLSERSGCVHPDRGNPRYVGTLPAQVHSQAWSFFAKFCHSRPEASRFITCKNYILNHAISGVQRAKHRCGRSSMKTDSSNGAWTAVRSL